MSAACAAKAQEVLTVPTSTCPACGLVFRSTSGFDDHRRGEYTHTPPDHGRRCLTLPELQARGYGPDDKGRLRQPFPAGRAWRAKEGVDGGE